MELDVKDETMSVRDCPSVLVRGLTLTSRREVRRDNNATMHRRLNGGLPGPANRIFVAIGR